MEFSNNNDIKNYNNKELFEELTASAALAMLRGVNMDLYTKTLNQMTNFIKEFKEMLISKNFSNRDLTILKNLLIQNRKIIEDLKQGENNE
mgnify:CR=1 FL=1